MDFVAIDFETANENMYSACSIGLVFVKDNQIVDEKYYLIKPPNLIFDEINISIHGITKRDVIGARNFDEVWELVKDDFKNNLVVAHNAQFDMSVLKSCLQYYQLKMPKFSYFCSIPFSTEACTNSKVGRSLEDRTAHFGINIEKAHNALYDARAVAQMILKCMEINQCDDVLDYITSFDVPLKNFSKLNHTEKFVKKGKEKANFIDKKLPVIKSNSQWYDASHPLFSKQIVFTGDMDTMDRKTAAQLAHDLGATIKNGVTRTTDYLVVGVQDPKLVGDKGVSTKEIKAAELINKGFNIQILIEPEFLELLNYVVPENMRKPISKTEIEEKERLEKEEKERKKRERKMRV